jgi:hypothetical protein
MANYVALVSGVVEAMSLDDAAFLLSTEEWIAVGGVERRAKVIPIRMPRAVVERFDVAGIVPAVVGEMGVTWHEDRIKTWFFSATVTLESENVIEAQAYLDTGLWSLPNARISLTGVSKATANTVIHDLILTQ